MPTNLFGVYRGQVMAGPREHTSDPTDSLVGLAYKLFEWGGNAKALRSSRVSAEERGHQPSVGDVGHESALAESLNNLAIVLRALGSHSGAAKNCRKSVATYRKLAGADEEEHLSCLASSLNNLAVILCERGNSAGAAAASAESVDILRGMARCGSSSSQLELAGSLNTLSIVLASRGDERGALKASRESVDLHYWLSLTKADPAFKNPALAASLTNLSIRLLHAQDYTGAQKSIMKALQILRRLAATAPSRHEPDLARALAVLSVVLRADGRDMHAAFALSEARDTIQPYAIRAPRGPNAAVLRSIEKDIESLYHDRRTVRTFKTSPVKPRRRPLRAPKHAKKFYKLTHLR